MAKQQDNVIVPFDEDAEQVALGSILLDNDMLGLVANIIKDSDFFIEKNRFVFKAMMDLYEQGKPCDIVALNDELQKRGQLNEVGWGYVTSLTANVPSAAHAAYYANLVKEKSQLRKSIYGAGEIARMAYEEANPNDIRQRAYELFMADDGGINGGLRHISKAIESSTEEFDNIRTYGAQKAMSTGLTDLDKLLNGGLKRGKVYTVGGRPGMGKSSIGITILLNVALQGYNVGMFSLEMKDDELVKVVLSMKSGIDSRRIDTPENLDADEAILYHKVAYDVAQLGIFLADKPNLTMQDLRHQARLLKSTNGLDLLVVDYLQLMQGSGAKGKNRQEEVSEISRGIKTLAMELDIPIISLSQLSRQLESRADKRPMLSDLRESGSLEQDSDVVLFVYRDEMYNEDSEFPNIAEIICAKHRRGATGKVNLFFKKATTQFTDAEVKAQPLDY